MSSDCDGVDLVGIEMDYLEKDEDPTGPDYQLHPTKKKKNVAGTSYEDRFESVLMGGSNQEPWWDAVDAQLKKDGDFAVKVSPVLCRYMRGILQAIAFNTRACRLQLSHRQKGRSRGRMPSLK